MKNKQLIKIPAFNVNDTPFARVRFIFCLVTAELAADWLKANCRNRRLKEATLGAYVMDMRNGAWLTTHQGVAFDADDNLIDGQHRLEAVVRAKRPVLMLVSTGWPTDADKHKTMDAVDRGVSRSLSDQLHLQHDIPPRDAAMAVKICNSLAVAAVSGCRIRKSTTDTVLGVFALYKNELNWLLANPVTTHGIKQATVLACLALARAVWPDKTADARERLITGENLTRENPLLHLRNWLLGAGARENNALVRQVTLHHLAAFVDGKPAPAVVLTSDEAYLRVMRLHKVRVEKIAALYGHELPAFITEKPAVEADKNASPYSAAAVVVGRNLPATFSSTDLLARTEANVGLWIAGWMQKKWIEPGSGMNQYRKTEKFGS